MEVIYVEGLPCAGKSLLVKQLELKGYKVIHELGRTIDPTEFPGNGRDLEETRKINDWFISKESQRSQQAGIFDRSFLTHLAYAYAYSRLTGIPCFRPALQKYQEALTSGKLTMPDGVVYLELSSTKSVKRQIAKIASGRRPLDWFWRKKTFLDDTLIAYNSLLASLKGVKIIRIDGELSTKDKCRRLITNLNEESVSKNKYLDMQQYLDELEGLQQ